MAKFIKKSLIVCSLLLLLAIAFFAVVISRRPSLLQEYNLYEGGFTPDSMSIVEKKTHLKFPDGSRGLKMYYDARGFNLVFAVKIEIPPDREEAMIQNLESIPRSSVNDVLNSASTRVTWWTPQAGTILIDRLLDDPHSGNFVHAFLCHENKRLILYLEFTERG